MNILMIGMVCTFLVLQACERTPIKEVPVTENVTFDKHIKPITSTVCIKCHSQGDMDFSRYTNAYFRRYTIYRKVVTERSMPLGTFLDDKDRALFRDWVNQGGQR